MVRFVTSLAYTRREPVDSSMTAASERGQHKIKLDNSKGQTLELRTLELTRAVGAEALCARSTRVWKGCTMPGEGWPSALVTVKDTWVDPDGMNEGARIAKILEDGLGMLSLAQMNYLEAHMPSVVFDTEVHIGPTAIDRVPVVQAASFPTAYAPTFRVGRAPFKVASPYSNSVHYRIVYGHVGVPLGQLKNLSTVFQALAEAVRGTLPSLYCITHA